MTTTSEALSIRCPRCKAAPESACRYVELVSAPGYSHTPKALARRALVGQETQRPHGERYSAYGKPPGKRRRYTMVVPSVVSPAVRAVRDLDLHEFEQMRAWLRANHHLLFRVLTPEETE